MGADLTGRGKQKALQADIVNGGRASAAERSDRMAHRRAGLESEEWKLASRGLQTIADGMQPVQEKRIQERGTCSAAVY